MTTKPRARKFRIGGSLMADRPGAAPADHAPGPTGAPPQDDELGAIAREGLTGRQIRMARRVAQKHGLRAASDLDAVRQLRALGVDPFQPSHLLDLVQSEGAAGDGEEGQPVALPRLGPAGFQLAEVAPSMPTVPRTRDRSDPAEHRAAEIRRIQEDLARRRRRNVLRLMARLAVFVVLPTIVAGWYFARVATPMFATRSEFVIQQADPVGAAGLGGLFQGTSMATQQDSMTVQAYLASRAALQRLDEDHGFRAAFGDASIDPIQRLPGDATNEDAYDLYLDHVKIAYDPTEGIVKMEVIAPDPALSETFSKALLGYAEEQVDQLTQRLREDQMAGAREAYEEAEARREGALREWLRIQSEVQQIDPVGETAARTSQISALESERQQRELELQALLSAPRPAEGPVAALRSRIADIEALIAGLRAQMTQETLAGSSLASKNTELRLAEENYTFQTVLVQQALTQMEAAQVEANRQVRYLSLGVEPVAPDEATYPRAFENTLVAFLILSGIYLMVSLTASILREQVTG